MRLIALLLLASALLPAQPGDEFCQLSGRVENAITGEPVRRASVVLTRTQGTPLPYSTTSDSDGQFAVKGVPPGDYRVNAARNGFVSLVSRATLSPRQSLTGLTLKLTPQAVVTGRIVDEEGEPMPHVSVNLQGYGYLQGRKRLMSNTSASTNDLGEYRIFGIAPGKYFLSANASSPPPAPLSERFLASPDELYVATYYPGVTEVAGAAPLDVPAGAQLRGIDMVLTRTRAFHIRGHVTHGMAGRPNVSMVQLVPRDGAFLSGMRGGAMVDAAGNFDIAGVPPGAYTLIANFNDSTGARRARMTVAVGRGNVDGLNLVAMPEISIQGRVSCDPDSPPVALSGIRLSLQQRDPEVMFGGGTPQARPDEQGGFEIANVAPDRYDLLVSGLPSGAYVQSARTERDDVLASGLDLTSGAAPGVLTVVISPRGATVSGAVERPGATVVLIPQEQERRERPYYYKTAAADPHGAFSLTGVPPGDYKLYAWEEIGGDAYLDPDFVKPVESKGESVTLREGEQKTVPLKMIPAGR